MARPARGKRKVKRNWKGLSQADSHKSTTSCSSESKRPAVAMVVAGNKKVSSGNAAGKNEGLRGFVSTSWEEIARR